MDHVVRFVKTRNPVSNVLARLLTFWKLIRGLAKLLVSVIKLKFFLVFFAHPVLWWENFMAKICGQICSGRFLKNWQQFPFGRQLVKSLAETGF